MKHFTSVRTLVLAGLFVALGVTLQFFSIEMPYLRVGLSPVPTMLAGLTMGPVAGAMVGLTKDITGFIIKPMGSFFPPITIIQMLYGVLPPLLLPLMLRLMKPLCNWLRNELPPYYLAIGLTQFIAGGLLMPAALNILLDGQVTTQLYAARFAMRLPQQVLHIAAYPLVTYLMVHALARVRINVKAKYGVKSEVYESPLS